MGCTPSQLTGAVSVDHAAETFERVWGAPLPPRAGLSWMQMLDAAGVGSLKALYVIGYDVLLSNPNATHTRRALAGLDLVIVQDPFMTETAHEFAHVILPAACSYEKDGTFMSSERRVQRVRKAVEPPAGVQTDAQLICALAAALDHPQGFRFASASEIWDEVRAVWPAGAGMSFARLERPGGIQWPCPTEDHPGTERLHADAFGGSRKAALEPVPYQPSPERADADYPYVLVTGRLLYQFNAATMTGRTPNADLQPSDVLRMAPSDAAREGFEAGARVLVRSRHGSALLPISIDPAQRPGEVFTTFHDPRVFINRVTSDVRDGITHTPEYKRTAVCIVRAPAEHVAPATTRADSAR
jgi:formate dehydrogenase major subunit